MSPSPELLDQGRFIGGAFFAHPPPSFSEWTKSHSPSSKNAMTAKRFCVLDGLASDRCRDPDEHHVEVLAQACMLESMTHAATGHDQAPNVRSTLRRVQATLGAPRARLLCHAPRAATRVPPSSCAPAAALPPSLPPSPTIRPSGPGGCVRIERPRPTAQRHAESRGPAAVLRGPVAAPSGRQPSARLTGACAFSRAQLSVPDGAPACPDKAAPY
jgi:hypothetical protein